MKRSMELASLHLLRQGTYLLGFSGGADSVALFHRLLAENIAFDIAIVDYGIRIQSKSEVTYAQQLAASHHKQCFTALAPNFSSNFEAQARAFRYAFFSDIITQHHYDGLILAHHFNDRIEWLLLRLGKGSGLAGLLGFDVISMHYASSPYPIIRPLLWIEKDEILHYCHKQNLHYFTDSSNTDTAFERNFIRAHFTDNFITKYAKGLQQSLRILAKEKDALYQGGFTLLPTELGACICVLAFTPLQALHHIANALKTQGYLLSRKQREEIQKAHFSCEIGGIRSRISSAHKHSQAHTSVESSATLKDSISYKNPALDSTQALESTSGAKSFYIDVYHHPLLCDRALCLLITERVYPTQITTYTDTQTIARTITRATTHTLPKPIKSLCAKLAIPPRARVFLYHLSRLSARAHQVSLDSALESTSALDSATNKHTNPQLYLHAPHHTNASYKALDNARDEAFDKAFIEAFSKRIIDSFSQLYDTTQHNHYTQHSI